jgi:hypothetical protein
MGRRGRYTVRLCEGPVMRIVFGELALQIR